MTLGLQALLAFIPIGLSGLLLIGLGWSAKRAMPLVYFVTAAIALLAWGVSLNRIAAATLEGLIITVQVLWIIFGALLLLNTLKHSGGIASIRSGFALISPIDACRSSSSRGCSDRSSRVRPASGHRPP